MKYYLKTNSDNIVIDALSFPHDGYVEYECDELPQGAFSGGFKLENGQLVEYPELKPDDPVDEMTALKNQLAVQSQKLAEQEQAIMELTTLLAGGTTNV